MQRIWATGGLEQIKGLTQLQKLYLTDTQVTDAGLEHLKGLTRLQELYLGDTQVTVAGAAELRKALPKARISGAIAVVSGQDVEEAAMEKAVAAQKESGQGSGSPVEITNSIGMKLRLIPAGEFLMGSDSSGRSDEQPQHKVRITKPFYLGVYEVTQAEYEKVMGENPSAFSKGGRFADDVGGQDTSGHPVEQVDWEDAVRLRAATRPAAHQLRLVRGQTQESPNL